MSKILYFNPNNSSFDTTPGTAYNYGLRHISTGLKTTIMSKTPPPFQLVDIA